MPSPPSSSSSNVRVRAFIDFWNFQLSLDAHVDAQLEAQGIDPEDPNAPRPSVDWKKLGPWLAQKAGAVFTTAGEKGVIRYEGLHIYASHDPYKIKDDNLRKWLKNTVDRFPGVQVTLKERRPKHPPKCPVCHEPVNTCPVPECTASMKGTVEKGIDTAIVTDMIRLSGEKLLRLFQHVKARILADAAGPIAEEAAVIVSDAESPKPARKARRVQPTKPTGKRRKTNGEGSYMDRAEAHVLSHKNGVTTRQVAEVIGQEYGSAHGTLRLVAKSRKTIVRRSKKWVPVPNAKRQVREHKMTIGDAVTTVFKRNDNQPLAAKDIYRSVKVMLPDAKKGSVDAQLVHLRKDGMLVQKGTAPHGGGLYCLANHGGAHAAVPN